MRLRLLGLAAVVLLACGPPRFEEEPRPPCPLTAEMKRMAPLVADYAYGLTWIAVDQSGNRDSILISRSLLAHPGGSSSTLLLFDRCETAHELPLLCRACEQEGNCPTSPTQCSQVKCLGAGGTEAETWVVVDGGLEYAASAGPDYADVRLRYSKNPRRLITRTFGDGGIAEVDAKVADAVTANVAGVPVDVSFNGGAEGRVNGGTVISFSASVDLPGFVPGHAAQVKTSPYATGSGDRVTFVLDGEELGLRVRGDTGQTEMA